TPHCKPFHFWCKIIPIELYCFYILYNYLIFVIHSTCYNVIIFTKITFLIYRGIKMKKLIILSVLLLVLRACNNKDSNNSAIDKIEKKYDENVGMYALNTQNGEE